MGIVPARRSSAASELGYGLLLEAEPELDSERSAFGAVEQRLEVELHDDLAVEVEARHVEELRRVELCSLTDVP